MAGSDFTVEVKGLLELQAKLLKLSKPETLQKAAQPVIEDMTKDTVKLLRRRAPRSKVPQKPPKKPRKGPKPWRDGKHAADKIEAGEFKIDRDGNMSQFAGITADDNSPGFYLKFHEYGTSDTDATPFARPTYQEKKIEFIQKMNEVYQELLEELEE